MFDSRRLHSGIHFWHFFHLLHLRPLSVQFYSNRRFSRGIFFFRFGKGCSRFIFGRFLGLLLDMLIE